MSTPTERPAMQIVTSRLDQLIQEIRTEYEAVGESFHAGLEHAVRVGLGLLEAKELVPHGEWLPWLAENFGFPPRTAQAYMQVASNTQRVAHLPLRQALKLLAESNRACIQGSGENELFTPVVYIEAARSVMGDIDLDPASHEVAQRTVQAAEYLPRRLTALPNHGTAECG